MIVGWISSVNPTSLALTLISVLIAIVYYHLKNRDLPPGPIGLPYIGYWPFLSRQDENAEMQAMKKKYGDIFSFTSFGRLYVNFGSIKALREAHIGKSECFTDRFEDFNLLAYFFKDGIGFVNGEPWKELRKFFFLALKDLGVISFKDSLSGSMYEAIQSTVDLLRNKKEEPVNIIELVNNKCTVIIRRMLFGENGMSDEQMKEFIELYGSIMKMMRPTNLTLTGDVPRYFILPFVNGFRKAMINDKKVEKLLYQIIDDRKLRYSDENDQNIIDEYLKERDARQLKGDPTARYFTDKALMSTLKQIVGDGVLAVASFIFITFKKLVDHPEEQKKVYEEIADVVGLDREPAMADKSKLTYTNAFILEILRTLDFIAYAPSLECTRETTLRGYRIPKGAITLMHNHTSHFDPEVYSEPEKFYPARFLVTDEKKRAELPITFGVGKRSCMGEGYSIMQVFLFLTTIIQKFELVLPEGDTSPTSRKLMAGKFLIVARPRNHK